MPKLKIKQKEKQCDNIAQMFNKCDEPSKAYICGFIEAMNMKGAKQCNCLVKREKQKLKP